MNNIFFALFAVLTLFISMVGGLLPQRLRTYQYMCLFMEILSRYIFFSPLGQPSTYIVLFCSLMLITLFSKNKTANISCALFGYLFCVVLNNLLLNLLLLFFHTELSALN